MESTRNIETSSPRAISMASCGRLAMMSILLSLHAAGIKLQTCVIEGAACNARHSAPCVRYASRLAPCIGNSGRMSTRRLPTTGIQRKVVNESRHLWDSRHLHGSGILQLKGGGLEDLGSDSDPVHDAEIPASSSPGANVRMDAV